jgi:hypothetical protein
MFNVSSLKIGDKVGAYRYSPGYLTNVKIGTVTKINKWGHIEVDFGNSSVVSFDKRGDERSNSKYGRSLYLTSYDEAEKRIEENKKLIEDQEDFSFTMKTLNGMKNGYGFVVGKMSKEDRDRIVAFLDKFAE